MKARKSWREKLERGEPRIVDIPPKMEKRLGRGKMLIPRPLDVDALVRRVEKGKLITQAQLRERLAQDHGVNCACPITTGIFLRIVAEAAEEDLKAGKEGVAPYWRVVQNDGGLNPKFPGGVEAQAARLRGEGHEIQHIGRKARVVNFQSSLQEL